MIEDIETIFSIQNQIFRLFRRTVGYPSDEAALEGIKDYASGKIRRLETELFEKFPDFLKKMDTKKENFSESWEKIQDKQENNEFLTSLEKRAVQYRGINATKPQLEALLARLKQKLSHQSSSEIEPEDQPSQTPTPF